MYSYLKFSKSLSLPSLMSMSDPLFEEGSFALASWAVRNARNSLVSHMATHEEKRTSVVALLAIPWSRELIRKVGTHQITAVISAAAARPSLSEISRRLRQTIWELWHADLTHLEGEDGRLWRDVLVKAHLFARLSPARWMILFAELGESVIFTPGDLKSIPLAQLHLVSCPSIQREMLRDLWDAVHAYGPRPDSSVNIRPSSGVHPTLDAFSLAEQIRGDSAEESAVGTHHSREARTLGLDGQDGPPGGPSKRMKKLMQDAKAPAEIREFMDSGRMLNVLKQTDLSLACVSSGLRCWGVFCDLNMLPHFPPTEISVLRRSAFFPPGRTFRMYLAHLVKGCQLNDCDSTSWLTERVRGVAKGLAKSKDNSFATRPAISKDQLCQLVRAFSLRDEFSLLAALGWIFLLRIRSEAIPMRRRLPTEDMSEYGQARSHSVLGLVGRCLVLKLHRRKHMSSGAILRRSCCCEGFNPDGDELHIPQLLCPVCSIWPVVRDRVVVGDLIFPSLQSVNLIRHLRSRGTQLRWPAAEKLGTHSLRRGAARALVAAGGTFAQLLRAGQWHGNAVRLYLDLGEDERRAMTDILIEGSDDDQS